MLERGGTGHRLSAISGDVLPIGTRRMEETVAEQEKDQKSERDFDKAGNQAVLLVIPGQEVIRDGQERGKEQEGEQVFLFQKVPDRPVREYQVVDECEEPEQKSCFKRKHQQDLPGQVQ